MPSDGSVPLQTLLLSGFSPEFNSWLLFAMIFLVIASGFFSSTETAYSCVSRIKLRTLLDRQAHSCKSCYNNRSQSICNH